MNLPGGDSRVPSSTRSKAAGSWSPLRWETRVSCSKRRVRSPFRPIFAAGRTQRTWCATRRCSPATRGAIAAPTAGLHFTTDLLGSIEAGGTAVESILLHVGPGTFEPLRREELGRNSLEPEYYEVDKGTAAELCGRRRRGGRLVAVGTTVVRTLETVVGKDGAIRPGRGWSGKFIFPPYEFKAIDALLTNFHLPRSSLLLLVAAFAGRKLVIEAYRAAVAERYRFYSYGDAMLIL